MLRFLTAGESHGPELTAILEGIPAGLPLDASAIDADLQRRQKGPGSGGRMRIESDAVRITGGVMAGRTTGAPIALVIPNLDHAKWRGRAIPPKTVPRPGHADLTGTLKYGYDDLRLALERASARETAARVAVGAVCRLLLAELGVRIGSYVTAIGGVAADVSSLSVEDRIARAELSPVRCPVEEGSAAMEAAIRDVMQAGDTLGGVFAVAALGLPPGLGSHVHWDRRLDARLAAALASIPAIKGVEIGDAFAAARQRGTEVHDAVFAEGGRLVRHTNRCGGTEGGVTNGSPLVVHAAMKPIATTVNALASVDLATGAPTPATYERSDFCAVPRAAVVGEAMVAFVVADALLEKLGGDSLDELRPRAAALHRGRLSDLALRNADTVFWE